VKVRDYSNMGFLPPPFTCQTTGREPSTFAASWEERSAYPLDKWLRHLLRLSYSTWKSEHFELPRVLYTQLCMTRLLKILFVVSFTLSALAAGAICAGYVYIEKWGNYALTLPAPIEFDFPRGTPLSRLARSLEKKGLVENRHLFRAWAKIHSQYASYQAGRYRFDGAVTPMSIAKKIIAGETYNPVLIQFTIPEGFTLQKIASRLEAHGIADSQEILSLTKNTEFITSLKVPSESLEGYLYPATYPFTVKPSAQEALTAMNRTFWEQLPQGYEQALQAKGLSLHEGVTFASLIELETRIEDEKPLVSEVIWNRLKKPMALAIDASIIYGIENYAGNITRKHLKDKTNPYNTRVHRGLPPTPIGSPSRSSLLAVLTPSSLGNYYYVLNLSNGSRHHFSKTLKEHNRHVQELIRERKRLRSER
jgi:UPF0755 protein